MVCLKIRWILFLRAQQYPFKYKISLAFIAVYFLDNLGLRYFYELLVNLL